MQYVILFVALSACAPTLDQHLQAEREYHSQIYDLEYVDDCFYYEDLICEFEQ